MSFLGLRSLSVLLVCIPTLSFATELPGPCNFASYETRQPEFPAVDAPISAYAQTDWVNKAIRDCLEPGRTKPSSQSHFAINVAKDHRGASRLATERYELDIAWQQVSELFWGSPENSVDFRLAQFDLRMKGLVSRSLAGWLPAPVIVAEPVTEQELAGIEEFILDEEYANIVAAQPVIAQQLQDDCPSMSPVVERFALDAETIDCLMVDEVMSLLADEAAPLTDEEIAYLSSGPADFVNSLDPYGYSEYNDYLDGEEYEAPQPELGAAWTIAITRQVLAAVHSTKEGVLWLGTLNIGGAMETARQAHQEREIRSYRTAERQVLERWDAVIDGFQILR